MIWQNPWAWAGLVTLGLLILIHLLGRGHARILKFPSLRFLERSRLLPTRRTRVHDVPLLLVRLGILAAAVAALAQPLFRSGARTRAVEQLLARAIVIDTSASMIASHMGDSARRHALRFAADAQVSIVIQSAMPARQLAGAVEWLERQAGRRELVVVSDFQAGALDGADVARVPAPIGIRLARVGSPTSNAPVEVRATARGGETIAAATLAPDRTEATWTSRTSATLLDASFALLAGAADATRLDAARQAAASIGTRLPADSSRAVAVVYPGYERRADVLRSATALDAPWMTALVAAVRADSLLIAAASSAASTGDSVGLVVARDAKSRPIVTAIRADVDGRARVVFVANVDAASLTSAALIAAVERARSSAPPLAELDPTIIPERALTTWQRAPSADARVQPGGDSDGRWFWVLALVLLAVETWMRRARRERPTMEIAHDRAA